MRQASERGAGNRRISVWHQCAQKCTYRVCNVRRRGCVQSRGAPVRGLLMEGGQGAPSRAAARRVTGSPSLDLSLNWP